MDASLLWICGGRRGEAQRLGLEREGRETGGRCAIVSPKSTILNKSWTGPLGRPNPYSPQENSLFVFVEEARKTVVDNIARYQIVGNRDFRACS